MSQTLTQVQTEELKLLRAVVNGTLPEYLEQNTTDLTHDIARELHDDGMFTGKRFAPIAGRASYVGAKIASRGRDRLAELEQLAEGGHAGKPAGNNSDNSNDWHDKPLGKILVGVVSAIISAFALYLLGVHFGLLK